MNAVIWAKGSRYSGSILAKMADKKPKEKNRKQQQQQTGPQNSIDITKLLIGKTHHFDSLVVNKRTIQPFYIL